MAGAIGAARSLPTYATRTTMALDEGEQLDPHPTPAEVDRAFAQVRGLVAGARAAAPPGLEVHADGNAYHEVQPGDGWIAIAREYSTAFGTPFDWKRVRDANPQVGSGLRPGQHVVVPGLEQRLDTSALDRMPGLQLMGTELRHLSSRGETLSMIAREYTRELGTRITWRDLVAANPELPVDGPVGRVPVGSTLRIPGISSPTAAASRPSIDQLADEQLLTRTIRMKRPDNTLAVIAFEAFTANVAAPYNAGTSRNDAMNAARWITNSTGQPRANAVVLARDGAHWIVPLDGWATDAELGAGGGVNWSYRRDNSAVVAVVERTADGVLNERRFDG